MQKRLGMYQVSANADRVREYKSHDVFKYNGINYARVIATRAYDPSVKNILCEYIRLCTYQYNFTLSEDNDSVMLFVYSYRGKERKDFDYIFDKAVEYADYARIAHDVYEGVYTLSFRNLFKIFKPFRLWKKYKRVGIKYPFYAAVLTAQFLEFTNEFNNVLNAHRYKACITFCDAHGVENMIAQMAKQKGLKTATLQHGQYRVLSKENEVADVEAYENFISDYLFAWGEKTREEFVKAGISSERIIPLGALKEFSRNTRKIVHNDIGVFGVILSGNIYETSNIRMISLANKIAVEYGMKYVLRMHPKNDESFYVKKCDQRYLLKSIKKVENKEYADMVDFSILHMTGVFVELLSINSPIFVYADEKLEPIFKLDNAVFSDMDEFKKVFSEFSKDKDKFKDVQFLKYKEFNAAEDLDKQYIGAYYKYLLS